MKNVLIINGHQYYEGFAEGKVTQNLIDNAKEFFSENEFNVKETYVEKGYEIKDELEKYSWADYILFQYPVYWMTVPWITKKYIDEIFSAGAGTVTYNNDGRSRDDASKKYGSGGIMTDKKYMLSLTYNCPTSEFDNKDGFFEGLSLDQANFAVHKVFQFCGAKPLQTYAMNDIYKGDLNLNDEFIEFKNILENNFLK